MIAAPVGFQCPQCVRSHTRRTRQNEGPYGGVRSADVNLTTIVLIAVNLAVWALIQATGGTASPWVSYLGLTPVGSCGAAEAGMYYPGALSPEVCAQLGGLWRAGAATGAVWQFATSLFTHISLIHLGCNLLTLWFLGPPLERALGRARFLILYFLSGLSGSAVIFWLSGAASTAIGASGAIFGLLAALLIISRKLKQDVRQILLWLGLNVLITVINLGSISWQGHLGGFLGGAAVTAILVYAPPRRRSRVQTAALLGYTAALAALTASRLLFL
jgi:membrane associated rhomboid family serine protease